MHGKSFYRLTATSLALIITAITVYVVRAAQPQRAAERFSTQIPKVEKSQDQSSAPSAEPAKSETIVLDDAFSKGPQAVWIWGGKAGDKDHYTFHKEFKTPARRGSLIVSCDNKATVSLNGKVVAECRDWQEPVRADLADALKQGNNVLTVDAWNSGGPAGLALKIVLPRGRRGPQYVVTDKSWQAENKAGAADAKRRDVATLGRMGSQPWGNVFAAETVSLQRPPRGVFQTLPGFQVELLYTVPKESQGSWVCLALDDKGRLLASDQQNKGLFRITPADPSDGDGAKTRVEKLDVKMSAAQGMLHAFGALYCSVNGGPGSGFYRLRDTNGDDQYDEVTKLKAFQGGGEHGPHALRLSPDGKSIYVIAGNHTDPPKDFDASRNPSNWNEDLLLPRQWDARGHARGKLAPGGWIARTDPEGKTWEIVSNGFRNAYDFDLNADGELLAYDADMEWDMGTPWYRPTRLVHAASGSEFGWRSGTGKWPTYFVDSLPPVVDLGPGSPVGAAFGYGAKFPAKYQKALYLLDWTFGTIYAVHLKPDGSTYTATKEEFLSRTPLPLTDAVIGKDGAMYFAVGGRGIDSALYRVTYTGKESTDPVDAKNADFADLRALRRQLEELHRPNPKGERLDFVWTNLSHEDRFIRYAARVALEHVPADQWREKALAERNPEALIHSAVALARQGEKSLQPKLLDALGRLEFASLSEMQQLGLLRAYALTFIRMGEPDAATKAEIVKRLDSHYPAKTDELNRELCRVLVYLNSPTVVSKTLKLMKQPDSRKPEDVAALIARNQNYGGTIAKMLANLPELQNLHYAFMLRNMRYGWTLEERQEYFEFLAKAATRSGGASYTGFVNNIRKDALENVSPAERKLLATSIKPVKIDTADLPKPKGPGRDWKLDDVLKLADGGLQNRSFSAGKRVYAAAKCSVCHRFDGEGGATGPDLTNLAGRFSVKDMTEAIVDPSKVISDQYRAHVVATTKGKTHTGRIATEENGAVTLLTDPEDPNKVVTIPKSEIEVMQPSKTSTMPNDLLKPLNKDEVLDLIAYLMSRGNPNDPMFRGK